jgi:hypothetical protein
MNGKAKGLRRKMNFQGKPTSEVKGLSRSTNYRGTRTFKGKPTSEVREPSR